MIRFLAVWASGSLMAAGFILWLVPPWFGAVAIGMACGALMEAAVGPEKSR